MDAAMTRTYLMYRSWTGYPKWFEPSKVNSVDDDGLPAAIVRYVKSRLKSIPAHDREAFTQGDGLGLLNQWIESGDRGYFPKWTVFGTANSEADASMVFSAVTKKLALALTFDAVPQTALPSDEWLRFELELGELDERIQAYEKDAPAYGWTRTTSLTVRQQLRAESVAANRILANRTAAGETGAGRSEVTPAGTKSMEKSAKLSPQRPASVSAQFWAQCDPTKRRILEVLDRVTKTGEGRTLQQLVTDTGVKDETTVSRAIARLRDMGADIPNPQNATGFSLGSVLEVPLKVEKTPKRQVGS